MKINPSHLHILAAIIDSGGLSEGAVAVGKSQPSLSRTVAMLEARLGSRLFEKGKRPLRPTELCQSLAAQGRVIAQASLAAQETAASFSSGSIGTVRLGGTPIFMDGVISSMIASFQATLPETTVFQSYGYLEGLAAQLQLGNIDLAISPVKAEQLPEGLSFLPLLRGQNVIACSPSHPLARKRRFDPSEIAAYPWIAPPAGSPLYDDLRTILNDVGIKDLKVSFTGGSLASILNVMSGSDALTVLPQSVLTMHRAMNMVTALPVKIGHPNRDLGLLWSQKYPQRPVIERFQKHLLAECRAISDLAKGTLRGTAQPTELSKR